MGRPLAASAEFSSYKPLRSHCRQHARLAVRKDRLHSGNPGFGKLIVCCKSATIHLTNKRSRARAPSIFICTNQRIKGLELGTSITQLATNQTSIDRP